MSMQAQSHPGSSITWRNAPTKRIDVGGTKFAYRQLGPNAGVPVIFLNHLAAELDRWDPRVVDGIATRRCVIVFNNRVVGHHDRFSHGAGRATELEPAGSLEDRRAEAAGGDSRIAQGE